MSVAYCCLWPHRVCYCVPVAAPPPLQDKVGEPVYLAGNSLGGYLGVNLAARHPEAIKGLVLLNATPFWSQRPPVGQETLLWQVLNVDAALPVTHVSRGGGGLHLEFTTVVFGYVSHCSMGNAGPTHVRGCGSDGVRGGAGVPLAMRWAGGQTLLHACGG